jgi:flagellin-like protein
LIKTINVTKTTKFKRSIKAISPVIATLLMIAIAVVASLVVYAWVTGYIGGTTSTAGKAIQIQSMAVNQDGNLVVYVQNVGQGAVELKPDQSLYVNSSLVPFTANQYTISEGQTLELITTRPDYSANDKVSIKVTTTDGTFMTTSGTVKSSSSTTIPTVSPSASPSPSPSPSASPSPSPSPSASPSPSPAPSIQQVHGPARGTSTSSTITVTLSNTPTSGNKLVAVIGTYRTYSSTARTVSSITETGVTWAKQTSESDSSGNDVRDVEIWLGTVNSGASTSISITLSGSPNGAVADVCEYSGLASSPLDRTAGTDNSGTSTSTGTTTTTAQSSELWIGGIIVEGNSAQTSPTNGFINRDGATYNSGMSLSYLEKIVSATGTANSGTTISTSSYWNGCIATFKGA